MPNNSPQFSLDIIVTDETSNEINEVISNCVCRDSGGGRCDIDRHLCEGAARRLGKSEVDDNCRDAEQQCCFTGDQRPLHGGGAAMGNLWLCRKCQSL